jgi:hypothetical protein
MQLNHAKLADTHVDNAGLSQNKSGNRSTIDLDRTRCYDLRVRLELHTHQHLRCVLRQIAFLSILGIGIVFPLHAQSQKPSLPDPVKFVNKFDVVANVVYSVLGDMDYKIEVDDRKGGRIATRPYEFITGALTSSEVEKVAVKNDRVTGSWLKAQYSVEVLLEIVSPTETMVTVRTKVESLNRDVDGTEKWITLDSLGNLERRILGKISTKLLMGMEPPSSGKKGFWDKRPQPVDSRRQPRFPSSPNK